jgi:hypothetical protein
LNVFEGEMQTDSDGEGSGLVCMEFGIKLQQPTKKKDTSRNEKTKY